MSRRKSTSWGASPLAPADPLRLTKPRVQQLKQLCHPDRHAQSALSVSVFQWLNEVSKELDKPTDL